MYDDKNSYKNSLGYKVRSIRLSRNLSQDKFSDELNVSRVYISDIERNKKIPQINFLLKISKKYNVSLDWLINEDYEKNNIDINNLDHDTLQALNVIIRKIKC